MSKASSRFQPTTLELDELDLVTGGRGIFESIGKSTGWYSEQAGKGLDIGSQIALSAVPVVGTAYGVAQGAWDTGTTAYDYFHGEATAGQVVVAAAGLAVSAIPASAVFHGLGAVAEQAIDHLATVTTLAGQKLADGLLTLGHGNTPSESHPEAGSDQNGHPNMSGDSAQSAGDQTASGSGDHGVPQDSTPVHNGDGNDGAVHGNDSNDGSVHGSDGHGDDAQHLGDQTTSSGDHSASQEPSSPQNGDNNDYSNHGNDGQGMNDSSYYGNDYGDTNFGGGDFGGGGFGGGDFGGSDFG